MDTDNKELTGEVTEENIIEIEEEQSLTIAEREQLISQKRDKLYDNSLKAAAIFFVCSVLLMTGFKFNEGFFDAHSRISLLMESVNEREQALLFSKINVKAEFTDKAEAKLQIPLTATLDKENVSIREEFTQKKFVITLLGYSENVSDGVNLVSDSSIMDAVGIYRQNTDIVVEVYCRDSYDYELVMENSRLVVEFKDMENKYDATAVVWLPYEDRNRLALPEWKQSLEKFAKEKGIKLYMASDMLEKYTQNDIITFANEINADMVIGVEVETSETEQSYIKGICNSTYYVPEYNSVQLSILMSEVFMENMQIPFLKFEEADERNPLVGDARVPSAIIKILPVKKDMDSVEAMYKLNEKIVTSLKNTISGVIDMYIKPEEKYNEN